MKPWTNRSWVNGAGVGCVQGGVLCVRSTAGWVSTMAFPIALRHYHGKNGRPMCIDTARAIATCISCTACCTLQLFLVFQAQREWTYFNYSNISNVPGPQDLERIHWETTYSSKPWSHENSTNAHSVQQWSNMLPVRLRLPVANLAAERLCEKKTEGSKQAGNLLRIGGWLCQM
jgi:hypothetical protein